MLDPREVTKVVRGDKVFYHVPWTVLKRAERHEVAREVPSLGGIFQVFWEDEKKVLRLFSLEPAWYGGLRAKIAEVIDIDYEKSESRKKLIEDEKLYYRFAFIQSWPDLQDLMFLYLKIYRPELTRIPHSGRYAQLHLKENPLVF